MADKRKFFVFGTGGRRTAVYVEVCPDDVGTLVRLSVPRDSQTLKALRDNLYEVVHELSDEMVLVEREEKSER